MPSGIYLRTEYHRGKIREGLKKCYNEGRRIPPVNTGRTRFKKNQIPWNRGLKNLYSLETITKMANGHKGKKQSKETIAKRIKKGEEHYNWKGGITELTKQIRHCFKYRQWRSDIFTRDDFTCQKCSKRGGWIEVDHYPKQFSIILNENNIKTLNQALDCEELWNINNGRTLCKKCHHNK